MKQKFISLALAVMLLLGVTGCAMSTPASVGSVGGVDIPAGIYLLAQYNAYNTASGAAKLATGETASNVKAVLKAECTGTINGEEVTTDGADYVARLTLRSLQYYAAVEKKFDELGGTLDEAATAEAAKTAEMIGNLLSMAVKPGNSSIFVGKKEFEIMKKPGRGTNGHIAIACNNVDRAIYHLSQRGVKFDLDSKNVKNGKTIACYFADEIAGFAMHLVQA